MLKTLRQIIAKRRLQAIVNQTRARNAGWTKHRAAQLSGERRERFEAVARG